MYLKDICICMYAFLNVCIKSMQSPKIIVNNERIEHTYEQINLWKQTLLCWQAGRESEKGCWRIKPEKQIQNRITLLNETTNSLNNKTHCDICQPNSQTTRFAYLIVNDFRKAITTTITAT